MVRALKVSMLLAGVVFAQAALGAPHSTEETASSPPTPLPAERKFVTQHKGTFGGSEIAYTATADDTFLKSHGTAAGALFSFSYVRQGVKDAASRPVTFVFNGGPGSSSLWAHIGVLGPARVPFGDPAHPTLAGPFQLQPNPLCPLDATDLVFIDPIGTGFSHFVGGGKAEDFYGVDEDALSVLDFIDQWLSKNHRWSSPKFVVGESYGTVRAAVLAKLAGGGPFGSGTMPGISLNGVILVGVALGASGEDASVQGLLPSLAATAWYHGKVDKKGRSFEAFLKEVRDFDAGEYAVALYAGNRLQDAQRRAIAARLAAMTGLQEGFILEHDLRLSNKDFAKELLRDRNSNVGMYDARYVLPAAGDAGDPVADDPAMGQYTPSYVAAFHQYLTDELDVKINEPYQVIAFREVNGRWNWGAGGPSANRVGDLAAAMRRNPQMKLMVASGYFDLVTPFAEAEYMVGHSSIPAERIQYKVYESGHMVYLGETGARAFATDVRDLVKSGSHP